MASPSYDGATGGKIRKRPPRRPTSTPYDRPRLAAAENSGWLSKLVDPASRLITRSAYKIFSSVFRKRLMAPDENHQSRQEVPEIASDVRNPSSQLQDQGYNNGDNLMNSSNTDGISELEQLFEQKTFTRVEFDHLTELLRSRTFEPVTLEPEIKNEKKEKEKENGSSPENKAGQSGLYGSFSTPVGNAAIPHVDPALPAELAKAYMGSRSSTLSTHSKVFQENTPLPSIVPYVSKPFEMSVAPRSAVHFSGFSKLHANEYATPKTQGRSTMCRMSCSPYFKVEKPIRDVYTGASSSQSTPRNIVHTGASSSQSTPRNIVQSGGKQVLKRGSLVLDRDFESFGPIRRVRQRSHFMSPSKDSRSTLFNKNVLRGSSSVCKPSRFDEHKYHISGTQDAENGKNTMLYAIPPKSSETAMKILQQLDKLIASPKDGSTVKLFNEQNGGGVDNSHESELSKLRSPPSGNQNRVVEENAPSKPAVTGVNLTTEACIVDKAAIPSTNASPGTGTSGSTALTPPTLFHVIAPGDSLVLDDDNYKTVAPVREAGRRASGSSAVAEKNAGFDLPTMPTSSLDVSTLPKEQVGAAVSNVGSMASLPLPIKSAVTDTVCQKVGASDTATGTMMKGSVIDRAGEMEKPANLWRTFENASASTTGIQNNGSVPSPSVTFPVFESRVTSTFSTSTSASSISPSAALPFKFGSSPQKVDHSANTQEKQFKETAFAVNNFSALAQPSTPNSSFVNYSTQNFSQGFGSSTFGTPTFGANPFTGTGFQSASPGKDQMNVEESITPDSSPKVSPFGQPVSSIAPFGSTGPPVFQFGARPNPPIPQNPSPEGSLIPQSPSLFVPGGSLVSQSSLPFLAGNPTLYAPGGGFSLGSGGGDKSSRKIFRAKRERKK